jgi:hypothetical protein
MLDVIGRDKHLRLANDVVDDPEVDHHQRVCGELARHPSTGVQDALAIFEFEFAQVGQERGVAQQLLANCASGGRALLNQEIDALLVRPLPFCMLGAFRAQQRELTGWDPDRLFEMRHKVRIDLVARPAGKKAQEGLPTEPLGNALWRLGAVDDDIPSAGGSSLCRSGRRRLRLVRVRVLGSLSPGPATSRDTRIPPIPRLDRQTQTPIGFGCMWP